MCPECKSKHWNKPRENIKISSKRLSEIKLHSVFTKAAAAAAVDIIAASQPPKRKRAGVKKEPAAVIVKPTAAAAAVTKPQPPPLRAWMCVDHPVLFGGRPGLVVCARSEEKARGRAIEELNRRGIAVEGKIAFEELTEGRVFIFQ